MRRERKSEITPALQKCKIIFLVFSRKRMSRFQFVLNEQLPGGDTISMTVVCTILFSVIAHGLSANPLVGVLAARIKRSAG